MRDYGLEKRVLTLLKVNDKTAHYVMGSGSVHNSEDVVSKYFLIQCKDTKEDVTYVQYEDVDRLYENSKKLNKFPLFIIRMGVASDASKYRIYTINEKKITNLPSHKTEEMFVEKRYNMKCISTNINMLDEEYNVLVHIATNGGKKENTST